MKRGTAWALGAMAVLVAVPLVFPQEFKSGIQRVWIENFPAVTRIEGKVTVDAPFPQATFVALQETLVTTAPPENTTRLIQGGTLDTSGYSEVVLSLSVQTKGDMPRAGRIGALLVPDVAPIQQAFAEQGTVQFPLEVAVQVAPGASVFLASNQPRFQIAFPRYRIVYFNTTEKAVTANLYAYLIQ
jgi:hypothetical protein